MLFADLNRRQLDNRLSGYRFRLKSQTGARALETEANIAALLIARDTLNDRRRLAELDRTWARLLEAATKRYPISAQELGWRNSRAAKYARRGRPLPLPSVERERWLTGKLLDAIERGLELGETWAATARRELDEADTLRRRVADALEPAWLFAA